MENSINWKKPLTPEEMKRKIEELRELTKLVEIKMERSYKPPLNFSQAAEYLGYTEAYLYKLTRLKKIPCYRPGGKNLFFFKEELDRWIRGREGKLKN